MERKRPTVYSNIAAADWSRVWPLAFTDIRVSHRSGATDNHEQRPIRYSHTVKSDRNKVDTILLAIVAVVALYAGAQMFDVALARYGWWIALAGSVSV